MRSGHLIFISILWCIAAGGESKTLAQALAAISLKTKSLGTLNVQSVRDRKGGDLSFQEISLNDGGGRIVFEITSPIEKPAAMKTAGFQRKILVEAYEPHLTPYAGEVANMVKCPPNMKPKSIPLTNPLSLDEAFMGRTNSRLTWGFCGQDPGIMMGANAYFYAAAKKQLIRVTYFQPENKFSREKTLEFFNGIEPL